MSRTRVAALAAGCPRLARMATPTRCYCAVVGLFLLIRGATTVAAGADYGVPGDGWRAILQLAVGALLLVGLSGRIPARTAVIAVGAIYAIETLLGLHRDSVLGIVPVDARDHVVHPALAILALIAVAAERAMVRRQRN